MKNKGTLILMALVFLPYLMVAQEEYEPFIVDGKVWYYDHVDMRNTYVYKAYFEGDTIVDGHLCKKIVEERPVLTLTVHMPVGRKTAKCGCTIPNMSTSRGRNGCYSTSPVRKVIQ